jgi:hypothetical protein
MAVRADFIFRSVALFVEIFRRIFSAIGTHDFQLRSRSARISQPNAIVVANRAASAAANAQKEPGMPGFLEPIWEAVFRLATWAALIFGALSIGSAFVSAWVGWEITDATQKDADKKIKAADE